MLPIHTENGARLAAVLPTALSMLTGDGADRGLPELDTVIAVVVDGLGWNNLQQRRGHARTIAGLQGGAIDTVFPSTTGAALATITTGTLPGQHGLLGYRIRHPQLGLRTTLSEWEGIDHVRSWQRQPTVFEAGRERGVTSYVIGRSAHRVGGLTEAILTGADYVAGDTIEERFHTALRLSRGSGPKLIYVYIDELDRAGHTHGCASNEWIMRLEQLDASVSGLLRQLPGRTGFMLTADHGMLDVQFDEHTLLDANPSLLGGIADIGGEPRVRYLYLENPDEAEMIATRLSDHLGASATVTTREHMIREGFFGPVNTQVADRIGDVVVRAEGNTALYLTDETESSRLMVGQHGGLSEGERQVPLLVAGAIPEAPFTAEISRRVAPSQ